jgi:predicted  nucleic acid-binding Zn-ribbon protein
MNLQIKIKYVQDELMKYNDDLYKNEEDLKQLSSQKVDTSAKLKTVNDIKSNQKIKTQEIVDLKKALLTATAEQKKKMEEIKKEMQDSSKKITSF